MLFFGVMPTWKCPAFKIKAVCFVGNDLGGTQYRDSVDMEGTIPEMYEQALRFCEGNLRHLQDGQSFNSEGHLEVSRIALEELIQNALVHREMLGTDVVKLLIFDNRIVIESPGCLPGDLTIDKIQLGCAEIRNPLIAQLCAKTMPYRGLGSGITRALKCGERIELFNDVERDKFIATIWRDSNVATSEDNVVTSEKKQDNVPDNVPGNVPDYIVNKLTERQKIILRILASENLDKSQDVPDNVPDIVPLKSRETAESLAKKLSVSPKTIKRDLKSMRELGVIKREGADFGGKWIVVTAD